MSLTAHHLVAFPVASFTDGARSWPPFNAPYGLLSSEQGFELPSLASMGDAPFLPPDTSTAMIPFAPYERIEARSRWFARKPSDDAASAKLSADALSAMFPSDVRAVPFGAFFPNDMRLTIPEDAPDDAPRSMEVGLLEAALDARSRARYEVQDLFLQGFLRGAAPLFSESLQYGGFGGITLLPNASGEYCLRSGLLACMGTMSLAVRDRALSFTKHTRCTPESCHADLLRLAAVGRLVALESGFVDRSSPEVLRAAARDDMELYRLTVQTPKNRRGGFVPSERREPTLAIIVGSPDDVREAWEAGVERFVAARLDASRSWRAHATRAAAALR
jgi:hypothetical protein